MKLIRFENYMIKVADEALLVGPIRRLYELDKSKSKENFMKQMSILFFVYDPRSNYSYIVDEKDRLNQTLEQEGLDPKTFKISKELQEAINIYKQLVITTSSGLVKSARSQASKIQNELDNIDYSNITEEKDRISAIKMGASVLSMVPKIAKDLIETERLVAQEIEEKSKARGNNEMSLFDGGIKMD